MGLQKIESLLGTGELRTLSAGARRIQALERLYHAAAPQELAAGSRVKACKAGTLIVVADNAAVAAKLRQMTGRLLEAIRKSAADVEAIRIEVHVGGAAYERRPASAKAALGHQAITEFAALAKRMPEGGLKNAIADLVERHSSGKKTGVG
jgi:hypothetical protein